LEVTVGQRKYHSPPGYQGPDPNQSDGGCVSIAFNSRKYEYMIFSQVYIGQIPKDVYEDALVTLFEPLGVIYDLSECSFTTKLILYVHICRNYDGSSDGKKPGLWVHYLLCK
jgi:hypothetical protein